MVKLGFSMWGGSDPEGPPLPIRRVRRAKIRLLCSLYANIKSQDLLYSQINSLGNALQFIDTNKFEIHPARNEKCDSEIA